MTRKTPQLTHLDRNGHLIAAIIARHFCCNPASDAVCAAAQEIVDKVVDPAVAAVRPSD